MVSDPPFHSEADELLRKAAAELRRLVEAGQVHSPTSCNLFAIAAELRRLVEAGQDYRAETILNAFPYLASDARRAVELVVLEFQLRRQLGQNLQPRDWYERFPQWREQLQAHLEGTPSKAAESFKAADSSEREMSLLRTQPYREADKPIAGDVDVPVLSGHEILEEIDQGGMGVVYRARDLALNRVVALKVIRSGTLANKDEVRRFYREACAAAQLRHPNIVPIYGMGLHERQHCFTMAFFPRGSLARHLAAYRRDVQGAVKLMVKVARAVQTAHERGIIHRDLKPGNILLDEHGEPVVSDFGLAKCQEAATQTLSLYPIGTPAYMAPEQARCEEATAASDIWSLGVILYELLTGQRPFSGDNIEELKQAILYTDPVSLRRLRPDLPRDLEIILQTCLEKEPKRRYPSAAALADDLERWLRGELIQARPALRWLRLCRQMHRWVGRKGVLLLLVGLLGAGTWAFFSFFAPKVREWQRQVEQTPILFQRALAEGKSVTLVEQVGPPKWYRWRTQKGRPPLPEQRKWPLQLDSVQIGPCLLELLPDPQQSSYRVSAEVRPVNHNRHEFGLYFACEELAMPNGPEQLFGLFRLLAEDGQVTKARLCLELTHNPDVNGEISRREWIPRYQPPDFSTVPPSPAINPREVPWRRIQVVVHSDTIQAFCDDRLIGEFSMADQRMKIHSVWRTMYPFPCPLPMLSPRGGVGLYVCDGSVYFRNVTIEPLSQP
jgi:serine/threonine protein kinase